MSDQSLYLNTAFALLGVALLGLILSIIFGFARMRDWIRGRREKRARDAASERVRLATLEAQRQRELAAAIERADKLNEMLVDSMIELALANDRIASLEHSLASKERMRSLYRRKNLYAKENGFTWPTRIPKYAPTARLRRPAH